MGSTESKEVTDKSDKSKIKGDGVHCVKEGNIIYLIPAQKKPAELTVTKPEASRCRRGTPPTCDSKRKTAPDAAPEAALPSCKKAQRTFHQSLAKASRVRDTTHFAISALTPASRMGQLTPGVGWLRGFRWVC
ncbi:hypothetical protein AXF42_Ash016066 [Apostasia shenzhenica]|uniref:Uncharacterized protein n=1 Tax=Apostasia shenzhenica TaxID=1088818 RepID=A0A2I0B3A7_9ASPA|nr:hypothetical protein AXF42_Ash016066 [Apostasia shenzhenica]